MHGAATPIDAVPILEHAIRGLKHTMKLYVGTIVAKVLRLVEHTPLRINFSAVCGPHDGTSAIRAATASPIKRHVAQMQHAVDPHKPAARAAAIAVNLLSARALQVHRVASGHAETSRGAGPCSVRNVLLDVDRRVIHQHRTLQLSIGAHAVCRLRPRRANNASGRCGRSNRG